MKGVGCIITNKYFLKKSFKQFLKNLNLDNEKTIIFHFKNTYKLFNCKLIDLCILNYFLIQYEQIMIHYALHRCDKSQRYQIIVLLIENLALNGSLRIREPLSKILELYEIINILESIKTIQFDYELNYHYKLGRYVDINCLKINLKEI